MPGGFAGGLSAMVHAIRSNQKLRFDQELRKIKRKQKREERRKEKLKKLKIELALGDFDFLEKVEAQIESNTLKESEINCPECHRKMCDIEIKEKTFQYCTKCKSCWLPSGIMKDYTNLTKDVPSDHLKSRKSRFKCVVCEERMIEHVFKRPNNLLVDQCEHGHGVYFEHGEFERAMLIVMPRHT